MKSNKKESNGGLDYKSLTLTLSKVIRQLTSCSMIFLIFILADSYLSIWMFWFSVGSLFLALRLSEKLTKNPDMFSTALFLSMTTVLVFVVLPFMAKVKFSEKDYHVYSLETGDRLSSMKGNIYHQYQALTRFDVRKVPPKKRVLVLRNSRCPVCQQLYLELLPETDWFRMAINEPMFWLYPFANGADIDLAIDNQIYQISMSQIWLNLYNKKTDEIEALFRRIIPMLETHSRAELLSKVKEILPPGVVLAD